MPTPKTVDFIAASLPSIFPFSPLTIKLAIPTSLLPNLDETYQLTHSHGFTAQDPNEKVVGAAKPALQRMVITLSLLSNYHATTICTLKDSDVHVSRDKNGRPVAVWVCATVQPNTKQNPSSSSASSAGSTGSKIYIQGTSQPQSGRLVFGQVRGDTGMGSWPEQMRGIARVLKDSRGKRGWATTLEVAS